MNNADTISFLRRKVKHKVQVLSAGRPGKDRDGASVPGKRDEAANEGVLRHPLPGFNS